MFIFKTKKHQVVPFFYHPNESVYGSLITWLRWVSQDELGELPGLVMTNKKRLKPWP
jgi:hypothetical protein